MLIFACILGWGLFLFLLFVYIAAVKQQVSQNLALETFIAILLLDPLAYELEAAGLRQNIAAETAISRDKLDMAVYYTLMRRALSYQPESFLRANSLILAAFDEDI